VLLLLAAVGCPHPVLLHLLVAVQLVAVQRPSLQLLLQAAGVVPPPLGAAAAAAAVAQLQLCQPLTPPALPLHCC
jgi:hypothetical protein